MLPGKSPFYIGFTVICEKGTITFDGKYGEETEQEMKIYNDDKVKKISIPSNNDYEEVIKHVISYINEDKNSSVISINEAIKSLKIALAVKEALN